MSRAPASGPGKEGKSFKGLNYDYTKLRKEGSRKHEALHA
jgi:hypothetical protein